MHIPDSKAVHELFRRDSQLRRIKDVDFSTGG